MKEVTVVGQEVYHTTGSSRIGKVISSSKSSPPYSLIQFEDGSTSYIYDSELEPVNSNSTRSKIAMKLNLSNPTVKEFLVRATYANPIQGVRETREFDTEAQAKDFAARSVVEVNKGAEAYIYRLERVARLPIPDVDWQANTKSS